MGRASAAPGLGLSIATRLVRLMGGERIDLHSEVGRGSTFSFVLPLEVREAAPLPDRAGDEFGGLRVLVVDDSATSYMLLEEMLSNWSAEVTVLNRARLVAERMQNAATRGTRSTWSCSTTACPTQRPKSCLRMIRLDPALSGTLRRAAERAGLRPRVRGHAGNRADVCIAKPVRQQLMRNALKAARLPREAAIAPAHATEERIPATEPAHKAELGLHVMVVDDNAINREVAVAMLEELGCSVALAEDGRPAVAHAQHERFDVIFMDCQMPGMTATRPRKPSARREPARPPTHPDHRPHRERHVRDRDRCLAAGMDSFPREAVQVGAAARGARADREATRSASGCRGSARRGGGAGALACGPGDDRGRGRQRARVAARQPRGILPPAGARSRAGAGDPRARQADGLRAAV